MFWNLVSKKGKVATLLIYGVIGQGWLDEVSDIQIANELEALGELEEINIRINSPGGDIFSGVAIYNALKNHPAKKNIIIEGVCASIATVVAMAGDTITMGTGSVFMIHNPLAFVGVKDSEKLKKLAETLDLLKELIVDIYMTKVNITREEIGKLMDDEAYLRGEEALEKGFITKIGIDSGIKNIINCFDLSHFKNYKPGQLLNNEEKGGGLEKNKSFYEKLKNLLNKETEEEKEMTKEDFKNKYPEIFKAIKEEGRDEERMRLKDLDELNESDPTSQEIIKNAKYTTFKNLSEVLMERYKNKKSETVIDKSENFIDKFSNKKEDALDIKEISGAEETAIKNLEFDNSMVDEIVKYANGGK